MQHLQAQRCHYNVILAHRVRSTGTTAAWRKRVWQTNRWHCLHSDFYKDYFRTQDGDDDNGNDDYSEVNNDDDDCDDDGDGRFMSSIV